MDILQLSERFGIHAEEKGEGFPRFREAMKGRRVLLVADERTARFLPAVGEMTGTGERFVLPSPEPVADEATVEMVAAAGRGYDYLLAVGAGTLNDLCKYAGFLTGKDCGVYATAPSMDGFTSGVTPLIEGGKKITRPAQTVRDILLDYDVLCRAPRIMVGAGVGDILAKYCALADWKMSSLLFGEAYNEEAASLMYDAVRACDDSIASLERGEDEGVRRLMDALLISGYAMVIAGSSRPASGAEHHMSHYLEMDFLRRGRPIPLHGVKVGLGTLVSLWLYHELAHRPDFAGKEAVLSLAKGLPTPETVEGVLSSLGCPVRFSQIGVERDRVNGMFHEAYKLRDRFTILALYCREGWIDDVCDRLLERFY